ncbi:hypothetical protein [Cohnella sp. WQ 127256]|uniref:hypothetical protein n=1 Tax=Cohnella sp. WQ 127256 TaxID=2938790 RepID=UPI002118877F|nr:hypothetical protein [Cohnella sp. WQ 127256]
MLISQLENRKRLPPLTPEHIWHPGLDVEIAALSEAELGDGLPDGYQSARAWKAALHLWNDSLSAAHVLVEHLMTSTGSALHGIIHRREGDYDNAKYWFHHAGDHPAFHSLQIRTTRFLREQKISQGPLRDVFDKMSSQGSWNPYLFINAVAIQENYIDEGHPRGLLEHIQHMELEALMRFIEGRIVVGNRS